GSVPGARRSRRARPERRHDRARRVVRNGARRRAPRSPDEHRFARPFSLARVDLVLSLHGRLATVLVLYYTAVGVWGLALGVRNSGPTAGFRGAIVIAEIAAIAQGAFGALVLLFLRAPAESLHIL